MKYFKGLIIASSILGIASVSCSISNNPNGTTNNNTTTSGDSFDYEKAITNFENKLNNANYKVIGNDFTVDAYSTNLVYFNYDR